jgi:hypothetical protein
MNLTRLSWSLPSYFLDGPSPRQDPLLLRTRRRAQPRDGWACYAAT